uniref:FERM domain-containing protein n=1 Tax=Strongyloides venezuelensis TaxID=75913 RepID=A0A0K0G4H2_STRVS
MKYFYLPVKGILKFNVRKTDTDIESDNITQFTKAVKEVYRHHRDLTGLGFISTYLFIDANKIVRFIKKFYKYDVHFSILSKNSNIFRFLLQEILDDINCLDFDVPDLAHTDDINSFICYFIFFFILCQLAVTMHNVDDYVCHLTDIREKLNTNLNKLLAGEDLEMEPTKFDNLTYYDRDLNEKDEQDMLKPNSIIYLFKISCSHFML